MKKQKPIGHQRLAKLATFLYRVPAARFEMGTWKDSHNEVLSLSSSCGTQACAIGWSTILFEADGFHFAPNDNIPSYTKNDGNLYYWEAVEAFFGLRKVQASELFGSLQNRDRGPRQVAKRIKSFLKTGMVPKI